MISAEQYAMSIFGTSHVCSVKQKQARIELSKQREEIFNEVLNEKPCFSVKSLEINGNDLKALGVEGIQIGAILKKLFEEVLDNTIDNNREELIKRANEIINTP